MSYVMHPDFARRVEYCPAHEAEIYYAWTRVKLKALPIPTHWDMRSSRLVPVRQWADTNISDLWACHINRFYFRQEKDATMFALRWS